MKKYYAIKLTVETVKRFETLAKKISMPRSTLHTLIDESFEATVSAMEKFAAKGKVTITDLFTVIGEQVEEIHNEEVKRNEATAISEGSTRIVKKRTKKKPE